MNQDFTVQKKQYLSEKKNSCRGVHLKKKNPAQAEGEKKNSCKLKIGHVKDPFLLPSHLSPYALPLPLLGTSTLGSSPLGTFVSCNAITSL